MGPGREFDRIREIIAALGEAAGPIGDDTAPVPPGVGTLIVSTDASVDEVHFRRDWLSPEEIGWRATASALSDLAAAGAAPAGVTIALTLPADFPESDLLAVMRGVGECASRAGCTVLGGDLTGGGTLSLTVTVFGHARRVVSRRGARPGDGVWVTGTLGGARAGLLAFQDGRTPPPAARAAFARPHPRLAAGQWLAAHGATAMMDISDGLGGDAGHLAAASGVGLHIELDRVPIHPSVHAEAARRDEAAAVLAATGGEDYELLVILPPDAVGSACEPGAGIPLSRIGTVVAGVGVTCTLAGQPCEITGFQHAG
jgi:thiamine-monophosphate kinase